MEPHREYTEEAKADLEPGQVTQELHHLGAAVELLAQKVARLDDRLRPVMRNDEPVAMLREGNVAADRGLVQTAEQIKEHRSSVERLSERLGDLLDRLEL